MEILELGLSFGFEVWASILHLINFPKQAILKFT